MTDSATARYGARQQSQGSNTNTWGDDKLNEVLRLMDRGSKGVQSIAMTGDQTLSWTNYVATNTGQCAVLLLTGSLSSPASLTVPSVEWQWDVIKNTTGQTVTVKTSAGAGVAIPTARQVPVFCDASDCYFGTANYIGADITQTNARDLVDNDALQTAIANAALPASAGTVLNSAADTTAGYLTQKITVSGALTKSTTNSGGNEALNFSVGDGGLSVGGLQLASFTAVAGFSYTAPVGGTVTLPTPTGSLRKIELSIFGFGSTALSGLINGASTFFMDGDQTLTITDASASRGWV